MRLTVCIFCALVLSGAVATAQQSRTTKKSKAVETATEESRPELTAVGGLGAGNLYTGFLALGAIYDNFAAGTYTASTALGLAQSISGLLSSAVEQVQAVQKSPTISAEDEVFLGDMVDTYQTLRREADYLAAYVQSGSDADSEKFQKAREAAWNKISRLLGIE